MERPMARAVYVAEDGPVGYDWEEGPWSMKACCPIVGEFQDREAGVAYVAEDVLVDISGMTDSWA